MDLMGMAGWALALVGVGWAITSSVHAKRARNEHSRERQANDTFLHASHVISEFNANGTALAEALRAMVTAAGADSGYIMLFDRNQPNKLTTQAVYSFDDNDIFPTTTLIGEGLAGTVAHSGQPAHFTRNGGTDVLHELPNDTTAAIATPIRNRLFRDQDLRTSDVVGVLVLISKQKKMTFQGERLDTITALGALLSMAVSSHWIGTHHRRTLLDTLVLMASTLESRDRYMSGRSQRLCDLSLLLGRKFGMSDEALEELRLGMLLQDIGSIKVPDAILHKSGRLTSEEFELLKQHTTFGHEVCRRLMMPRGVLTIVRNHHERLDGTGYPDQLKGEQMPLALRIAALAIAFDAMASPRAFRTALDLDEILAQLNLEAGTHFDAVVVQTLRESVHDEDFQRIYPALVTTVDRRASDLAA
ncbi:MAG TPA: HD domain-containing phosphohydrolase [Fimbriimonadaceae bacterium]|nr:hypothetical protein [Armatimonadota bacterium]HRD31816.1 HD domain-containing phosphohydrolase [Fimbriimonadaceae bacterium]HRE94904.1 HD domain-containing phosphohydrolase [Fimbriimonadaceae bacterium]HRI73314.1 HD domain-containing phosphohydrolase [Fimbriimonadaceae bacterium]